MKNHIRFILTLAIVTTCATFGLPQDANTTPQRIFTHNGEVETSYDQVKGITTVRTPTAFSDSN